MKKKIKDLTLLERATICGKNKNCHNCSLLHTEKCAYEDKDNQYLEREVEVDE